MLFKKQGFNHWTEIEYCQLLQSFSNMPPCIMYPLSLFYVFLEEINFCRLLDPKIFCIFEYAFRVKFKIGCLFLRVILASSKYSPTKLWLRKVSVPASQLELLKRDWNWDKLRAHMNAELPTHLDPINDSISSCHYGHLSLMASGRPYSNFINHDHNAHHCAMSVCIFGST